MFLGLPSKDSKQSSDLHCIKVRFYIIYANVILDQSPMNIGKFVIQYQSTAHEKRTTIFQDALII